MKAQIPSAPTALGILKGGLLTKTQIYQQIDSTTKKGGGANEKSVF
jgi:hypothetical protein